jgi:hypothetical protein
MTAGIPWDRRRPAGPLGKIRIRKKRLMLSLLIPSRSGSKQAGGTPAVPGGGLRITQT